MSLGLIVAASLGLVLLFILLFSDFGRIRLTSFIDNHFAYQLPPTLHNTMKLAGEPLRITTPSGETVTLSSTADALFVQRARE